MKLREIYDLAIATGIENDPRGKDGVEKELKKQQKIYDNLKDEDKEFFDQELLKNPFGDSRILHGSGEEEIGGLIAGIDMETPELVLADRLREKGKKIDLVLAHHPEGVGMPGLGNVMNMQAPLFVQEGVPVHVAEGVMAPRISQIRRGLMASNFQRAVDAARLLDLPFLCAHTPCDNLVHQLLTHTFEEEQPETVGDVLKILMTIPEYRLAAEKMDGPALLLGKKDNSCGRIHLEMSGGTGTAKEIYEELSSRGVGTIVGMHMREECRKEAEKHHLNVIIAGHMASDSIGVNLFLDKLAARGVAITAASGLLRVERKER